MANDAGIRTILHEIHRGEFTSAVGAERTQLPPRLCFCSSLELLDGASCLIFGLREPQPHVAVVVVDEQQEVSIAARRRRSDGPADVSMHELESKLCPVLGLGRKRCATLLPCEAALAQLVDVVNEGQPAHHVALRQLPQPLEVEVREAGVPLPCLLCAARGQAHRLGRLHLQLVQTARRPPDASHEVHPLVA